MASPTPCVELSSLPAFRGRAVDASLVVDGRRSTNVGNGVKSLSIDCVVLLMLSQKKHGEKIVNILFRPLYHYRVDSLSNGARVVCSDG